MYISHLSVLDFRNHAATDLELNPGPTALVGRNGQGKTNLVEAIGYAATLSSHRVANDAPLIRAGAERAIVRARVVRGERASTIEVEITAGKANRARVNRGRLGPAREILGILRTVLFAPEDLALVKGDPDGRRRFLDGLMVQLLPRAAAVLADYERVNRQRAALLKAMRGAPRPDLDSLSVWNEKAAALGGQIIAWRFALTAALQPLVARAYAQVSDSDAVAGIEYRTLDAPGEVAVSANGYRDLLLAQMAAEQPGELRRGTSLVGPHRDDLLLEVNALPAKGYASHGESWSLALALRLASYYLLGGTEGHSMVDAAETAASPDETADSGVVEPPYAPEAPAIFWDPNFGEDADPVLILDDVFAELDLRRRERLADLVSGARQVLITAAVPDDVPARLLATRINIEAGAVKP